MLSFEQELLSIERFVEGVAAQYRSQSTIDDDLNAIQKRLAELESAIPKWIQAMSLTQRQTLMLDKENLAICQWSAKIVRIYRSYYLQFAKQSDYAFMLGIVFERMAKQSPEDISSFEEIVDLSIKLSEVRETEALIDRELKSVDEEIRKLDNEYYQLGIFDSNWDAAGSLQARLSDRPKQFYDNVPAKNLAHFLKALRAHTLWRSNPLLRKCEEKLKEVSQTLARAGVQTTSIFASDPAKAKHSVNALDAIMSEAKVAEQHFAEKFLDFMNELPREPRPTFKHRSNTLKK